MAVSSVQVSKKQKKSSLINRKYSLFRDREVACSTSDRRVCFSNPVSGGHALSSHSSHHPQNVLQALLSLHVHKDGLQPYSFYLIPPTDSETIS